MTNSKTMLNQHTKLKNIRMETPMEAQMEQVSPINSAQMEAISKTLIIS